MSLQAALHFIQKIRRDETLRKKIERHQQLISFEDVVALGSRAGFAFTADDLRTAFKHDWAMRWCRYTIGNDRSDGAREK